MRRLLPALVFLSMLAALWLVFVAAPPEREMGQVQRIFYFHVGSAWVAFVAFFVVAGASATYLRSGSATADRLAHAAGEVGIYTGVLTPTVDLFDLLRRYWGYDSFRPRQEQIVRSLLAGHDVAAIMTRSRPAATSRRSSTPTV